jgi:hypothetical protein
LSITGIVYELVWAALGAVNSSASSY